MAARPRRSSPSVGGAGQRAPELTSTPSPDVRRLGQVTAVDHHADLETHLLGERVVALVVRRARP